MRSEVSSQLFLFIIKLRFPETEGINYDIALVKNGLDNFYVFDSLLAKN